jgi:hypothetical protein
MGDVDVASVEAYLKAHEEAMASMRSKSGSAA